MSIKSQIFSMALVFTLLFSLVQVNPAAALSISGVSPASAVNNSATDVSISGSGFSGSVTVELVKDASVYPLTLKSWSENSLVVSVPAGIAPDTYQIRVSDGVDTQMVGPFTVTAPPPTPAPATFGRPQLQVRSYRTNVGEIRYGQDFNLVVRLENAGQFKAVNVQANFTSSDLVPIKNGGVMVVGNIESGSAADASQQMTASGSLAGKASVIVDVNVSYYDEKGTPYSEKFTLTVPVVATNYVPAATPTPTGLKRAQLVITSYQADVEILQPGTQFALELGVQNLGNASARGVTMIVGGGSSGSSPGGTPQPGGVSGGSGEFTNFAPVGASNIQSLGDFAPGANLVASQNLIVNVSTNPGAYPMKITFAYLDEQGNTVNDEQVITLLVYSLPSLDVSFYQPVGQFFVGQPNFLPLQVVNLGKKMAVLGNMKVSTTDGMVENGQLLLGSLEAGGYNTLDSMIYPNQAGPLEITVTIEYTDDFNQPRSITKTLTVDVIEMEIPPVDPNFPEGGDGGFPPVVEEETFWQKAWRFILGLFGLDSGQPPVEQPAPIYEEPMPAPDNEGIRGPKG